MSAECEILVVGAGVIGLTSAVCLAEAGLGWESVS
jgi:glycine/D-amino acid oxidase-like deaminating enzyme